MCVHVCIDSADIHSIKFIRNLMPVLTVSTCMHILHGLKALISAFQNFFRIENPLNINKLMNRNVSMHLGKSCKHQY